MIIYYIMIDYKYQYLKYKNKYLKAKNERFQNLKGGKIEPYLFKSQKFISVLHELNNTFLTYFVRNYKHHQGDDVSDHAIWTALVVIDWLNSSNNWIKSIDSKYHELLVFSAFIHDIGKTGDGDYTSLISSSKPTHHDDGIDILMGKKRFITYSNDMDAATKSTYKNPLYTDNRTVENTTDNALQNIREYSTNVETMFKNAGFTKEDLLVLTMIVGMVDAFQDIILDNIDIEKMKNSNTKDCDKYNVFYKKYKIKFDALLNKLKAYHNLNNTDILNSNILVRMCLAISAANMKGNILVKGQLHDLPIPSTVYDSSLTQDKFKDYDKYYKHVESIVSLFKNSTTKITNNSKSKKNNNSCCIQ